MNKVSIFSFRAYAYRFLSIKNPEDLCKLLGVEIQTLHLLASNPDYLTFSIKKKSGGLREINSPVVQLSHLQRRLTKYLNSIYLTIAHPAVYSFIKEPRFDHHSEIIFTDTHDFFQKSRSIIGNAKIHVGRKNLLNIDLSDFFGSCSAARVRQVFLRAPFYFDIELATALALVTTYRKKLPAGAPSSPILTNFIMLGLDKQLADLSRQNKITYSRYADDLTFSSDFFISAKTIQSIRGIIDSCGFRINYKKFRIQKNTARQIVTGIKVNKVLNVDRKYIRNLRAILFNWEKMGVGICALSYFKVKAEEEKIIIEKFKKMVRGRIDFIGNVKGKKNPIFQKLQLRFEKLQGAI